MPDRLYLDHNATSPMRPEVREAMAAAMGTPQNPSSVHCEGRAAKAALEAARSDIAAHLGAQKEGVVFTSGGTEAITLALCGLVRGPRAVRRLIVSATEHDAVRATAEGLRDQGVEVETWPVGPDGVVDLSWLDARMADYDHEADGPFLVCAMLANNETGVINPVREIGPKVWPKGGLVMVDAVQGVGKLTVDFDHLRADLMPVAAHKIGGPVGVGALIMKTGLALAPLLRGGGQELYRRAGTENLASIEGFAAALRSASPSRYAELSTLRDEIENALPPEVTVWGASAPRLPNTLCFSAPGFRSETQVMLMDLAGMAISAGSACSSGKVRASAVLTAMGASDLQAQSAIRLSLGWDTPSDAGARFVDSWTKEFRRITGKDAA